MNFIADWVRVGIEKGASDLHLEPGTPVVYRIRGELMPASEAAPGEVILNAAQSLMGTERWHEFQERHSVDFSRTISGARCRINVFRTARGVSLSIRLLSSFKNTVTDCNLHPDLKKLVQVETGLVLISGPTGSGKSTTLAALIEELNSTGRKNILTIESPIEYYFANRLSFVRQREVQSHTPSFEQAIVDAMREDPDVLVIGEMRTPDVMRLTLNAAETGHLVLSTVHSSTCAEALMRLCMSFPSDIQPSVRAQLADCLVGVVSQRLAYQPQLKLQIPHLEVLMASSSVKALIRSGQFSQLVSAIQTGGDDGMWSFDRYQRWIDQKRDWVRPGQAARLEEIGDPVVPAPSHRPMAAPARTHRPAVKTPAAPLTRAHSPEEPASSRIEIPDADLNLDELAKQISDDENESG